MTPEQFRHHGHRLIDWLADHQQTIANRPVQSTAAPGDLAASLPRDPPHDPEPFDDVIADLDRLIVPGLSLFQHPRFFGYFPANAEPAGILGDLVSTGLGVLGLSWQSSPALTELEDVTTDWVRRMVGLSDAWRGVIADTASSSTLTALITARERATDYALSRGGLQAQPEPLAIYVSDQSHSSVDKAALLAGFGRDNLRLVPCDDTLAIRPDALASMIAADRSAGIRPCAIVATTGTTATTAIDPIRPIADIARDQRVWLHVDAAMAGSAMILPECRHLWDGIEGADSIVLNAHKWLGVPFDCSLYYVRDAAHLVRVMSTNPSFLRSDVDDRVRNLRDWGIPLGRRFRALKLWFTIRDNGVAGLQARLRRDIANARWLAEQVAASPDWRVVAPVSLQTVCVVHQPPGLAGEALDDHTRAWADAVNRSGRAYLTPAVAHGRWMVRVSIGALPTEQSDVAQGWSAIRAAAENPTARSSTETGTAGTP